MPAYLISAAPGKFKVIFNHMMEHEVRTSLTNALYNLKHSHPPFYWRATNNKNEHLIALNKSHNHRDNFQEVGISVSEHPGYQIWGYRYVYPVSGTVIDRGSDGEPLLADAKALDIPRLKPSRKYLKLYKKSLTNQIDGIEIKAIINDISYGKMPMGYGDTPGKYIIETW